MRERHPDFFFRDGICFNLVTCTVVRKLSHFYQEKLSCRNKHIHIDQGGEINHNPDIVNLFKTISPVLILSHQISPFERAQRTIANSMRALLSGTNLGIKFWPFAFYHSKCLLSSAFQEPSETGSPFEKATGNKEGKPHQSDRMTGRKCKEES